MKWIFRGLIVTALLGITLFAPLLYTHVKYAPTRQADLTAADAALVFGALVHDGNISPLHKERLDAAIDLLNKGLISTIVVSNTSQAANVMANYLQSAGIPENQIEIDGFAYKTSDTCQYEHARNTPRDVILISQSFHIPRLTMLCLQQGISAQTIAAEHYRPALPQQLSTWRIFQIRTRRHTREVILLWVHLLSL